MSIDLRETSCCLISKEAVYPIEILRKLCAVPFGEFLILTHSDSPFRKYELFSKAKFDWLYYQDDDAVCPVRELAEATDGDESTITLAMKRGHFESYANTRMTMGLGWGSFFHRNVLGNLKRYTDVHGEDELFKRDTEKILTSLCYPQKRLVLPIQDLPSASFPNRLWRQPNHYQMGALAEQRCTEIIRTEEEHSDVG